MKKIKTSNRPMVETTDTMNLPNGGVITVKPIKRKAEKKTIPQAHRKGLSMPSKDEQFKMFQETGLTPEERLLCAIFGEKCEGLPKEERTKKNFNLLYGAQLRAEKKMAEEEAYIHGGKRVDFINEKAVRYARRELKAGKSYAEVAKEIGTTVYSLKFRFSADYNKPHILLLGEAQLRNAQKTGDKKLEKVAFKNIEEGKKVLADKDAFDKDFKAKRKAADAKARKIANSIGVKVIRFGAGVDTMDELHALVKAGKAKPGRMYYLNDGTEFIFDGKKFINTFDDK